MLKELEQYYFDQPEDIRECLMALRDIILEFNQDITPLWKWQSPFFYYQDKMFCYLWVDRKIGHPYIGFVRGKDLNHPSLEKGDRSHIKIFRVQENRDLPIDDIHLILGKAIDLYQ